MVKFFPPALGKESMAIIGDKRTYEDIPNPAKPEKKKRKSDSASVRFLKNTYYN